MRYFVEIAGREHQVTVRPRADGTLAVEVNGREMEVDALAFGPREQSVRVDGRVVDLLVGGALPQIDVVASGRPARVRVESERLRMAARATAGSAGARERDVRSPMPGRVVKVLVAEGDEVAAGQAVAIVEAMKMENEVRAKKGGVVARVHQTPGATVETNAVLVSFAV